MNIYEKLQIIQSKLKAPKSQYNKFGGFAYRNCEDILEAAKPLLAEVKAVVTLADEIVLIGERFYIKATATLIDAESNEPHCNKIHNTAYAREEESKKGMDGSQVTGASSSYARKYALNGLFAIDDNKDSDTTNTGEKLDEKALNIELPKTATNLKKPVEALTNEDLKACNEQKKKAIDDNKDREKERERKKRKEEILQMKAIYYADDSEFLKKISEYLKGEKVGDISESEYVKLLKDIKEKKI